VRDEIDAEQHSEDPQAGLREVRQHDEAGNNAERARQQHDPAGLFPVNDAQENPNDPRQREQQAQSPDEHQRAGAGHADDHIGQDHHARSGQAEKHDAEGDVQETEKHLPCEAAPSPRPDGVNDLEGADENGGGADEGGAYDRREGHVRQDRHPRKNHDAPQHDANPARRSQRTAYRRGI
jgi:hypothetical protein